MVPEALAAADTLAEDDGVEATVLVLSSPDRLFHDWQQSRTAPLRRVSRTTSHLEQLVVKATDGAGGYGMLVGPHSTAAERVDFAERIKKNPRGYIAQPTLSLSRVPTIVGDNVWCGANVVITSGVTIGERSVIGANSVVTTDLPPRSIAAGAPARVLRTIEYA